MKSYRLTFWIIPILFVVGTAVFHIHTYWWSVSLTVHDVRLTTDEGLVSLVLPLTRISAYGTPDWEANLYKRGPYRWETKSGRGRAPLRSWMARLDKVRADGAMFADFGYWKGSWQSDSRPGPFIVLFVPIWFLGLASFGVYLAFHHQLIRFRLRTLFIVLTLTACALYPLTLRAN